MILALDVGNTQIYGGIVKNDEVIFHFRRASKSGASSDEIGIFLRVVMRENGFEPDEIEKIAICSVVPQDNHSLASACVKYFDKSPFFLDANVKTGLKNRYDNPSEVGADRIANAIAALKLYPEKNLIVIDLGTATTFCAISKEHEYKGGVILAGLRLSNDALGSKAAKLSNVEIRKCDNVLGTNTVNSMQSGLYYGHLGAMKEIISGISQECFNGEKPFVIGTGGFSSMFEGAEIFDAIEPDLVIQGLLEGLKLNKN
jgi:type III pantothenate kinase